MSLQEAPQNVVLVGRIVSGNWRLVQYDERLYWIVIHPGRALYFFSVLSCEILWVFVWLCPQSLGRLQMERQWLESCVHATQIAHTRGSSREDNEAFVIKQFQVWTTSSSWIWICKRWREMCALTERIKDFSCIGKWHSLGLDHDAWT